MSSVYGVFEARLPTPFAVLGIRTEGDALAEIRFLPKGGRALAPRNRLAARVCAQIGRYLSDPKFRFDRAGAAGHGIPAAGLGEDRRHRTGPDPELRRNCARVAVGAASGGAGLRRESLPLVVPATAWSQPPRSADGAQRRRISTFGEALAARA
jgi:hypothetical protein